MKVTVLSENHVSSKGLYSEHGVSFFVQTRDKTILFDMGQSGLFLKNAHILGIDVSKVDAAVLSHGHYDHGGGAIEFLNANKTSKLYVNENAFGSFYSPNGYIGLDKNLKTHERVVFTGKETPVFENVTLYSAENVEKTERSYSGDLEKECDGKRAEDDFSHEQYMLIEENGKRVLFSGCSHRGILNILQRFKPNVFIGGFHLSALDYGCDELKYVGNKLSENDTVFYTCHCTGIEQYSYLKKMLTLRLNYINCGKSITV